MNIQHNLFHHGLIKLLMVEELKKKYQTWNHFLFYNGLKEDSTTVEDIDSQGAESPSRRAKSSPTKKRNRVPVETPTEAIEGSHL
jgi:hypothetical protein